MFGQHVKHTVLLPVAREDDTMSRVNPLRNVITVMMASQRALDTAKLPSERNKKDKLFNDLFESKQWVWSTGGVSHGQKFISQLQECL